MNVLNSSRAWESTEAPHLLSVSDGWYVFEVLLDLLLYTEQVYLSSSSVQVIYLLCRGHTILIRAAISVSPTCWSKHVLIVIMCSHTLFAWYDSQPVFIAPSYQAPAKGCFSTQGTSMAAHLCSIICAGVADLLLTHNPFCLTLSFSLWFIGPPQSVCTYKTTRHTKV